MPRRPKGLILHRTSTPLKPQCWWVFFQCPVPVHGVNFLLLVDVVLLNLYFCYLPLCFSSCSVVPRAASTCIPPGHRSRPGALCPSVHAMFEGVRYVRVQLESLRFTLKYRQYSKYESFIIKIAWKVWVTVRIRQEKKW
jgi:hypothetical protein